MKVLRILLFLIVSNVLLFSCAPSVQLNRSMDKIEKQQEKIAKILKDNPDLQKAFDTTSNVTIDSTSISIVPIDTVKTIEYDTSAFVATVDSLLDTQKELDSILSSTILTSDQKVLAYKKLSKQQENQIEKLAKGSHFNGTYAFEILNLIETPDTSYTEPFKVRVIFEDGIITLNLGKIITKVESKRTSTTITYDKQFTFWQWIKDERTLFVIALLLLVSFAFFVFIRYFK